MNQILRNSSILVCLSLPVCKAQTPTKPTPQAAYQEAVRPFDLVRRDPHNWSEIEIAALKTAELTANASCLTRSFKEFEGDDLLAYARLCTFGRAWEPVELAAAKYIRTQPVPSGAGTAMRSLASAFDYEVQAALRLLAQAEAPQKSAPKESAKGTAKPGAVRAAPFAGENPAIPHNELQLDVKPTAASLLAGSPAFAVPKKTLEDFVADDFPLVVVVDHDGIVRAMQVGNDTVLVEGGQIDQLVDHVVKQWPVPKP